MKKIQFFISLLFLFLMLSDPESGCYSCDSSISTIGILSDTTLKLSDVWEIDIQNELWEGNAKCGSPNFAPEIDLYQSQNLLEVIQNSDSLFITALNEGITTLTLATATLGRRVDPLIVTQTIQITVVK